MNKRGVRFLEKRVKINPELLRRLLAEIKVSKRLSWPQFAKELGVSVHSISYDWPQKGNTVPYSIFKQIVKLHPSLTLRHLKGKLEFIEPFWGQRIGKKSKIEDKVVIPSINSVEFAEFYGMLLGDGCIYSNLVGFCISSNNSTDKGYIEKHVTNLVFRLFNIKPKLYYSKNSKAVNCVLYSNKIAGFLVNLGFPPGKKRSGNPEFLATFFDNKELCKACLRGLADTDGSICDHPSSKIMLNISITSRSLLDSCLEAFRQLNIPAGSYNKGINLYGKVKLNLYFELIGSSNIKHIYKYRTFLSEGEVPDTNKTEAFLSSNKNFAFKLPYYGPMV